MDEARYESRPEAASLERDFFGPGETESPASTQLTYGTSADDGALTAATSAQNILDALDAQLTTLALGTHELDLPSVTLGGASG